MFFIVSKIIGILIEPLLHGFYFGAIALFFHLCNRKRLCTLFLGASLLLPLLYSVTILSSTFLRPLENHATPIKADHIASLDGVIILGGHTISGLLPEERGAGQLGSSAERFISALALADRFPDAEIWFTGLSGTVGHKGWTEGDSIRALLHELNRDISRFQFEEGSRNTAQNAVMTFALARPSAHEKWALVTSASHMRRASASFARAGWPPLLLYPVDYQTRPANEEFQFRPAQGFSLIRTALHEYVGLIGYWVFDKI